MLPRWYCGLASGSAADAAVPTVGVREAAGGIASITSCQNGGVWAS